MTKKKKKKENKRNKCTSSKDFNKDHLIYAVY